MRDSSTAWLASASSEGERYLRTLEVAGIAPPTTWSIRPFSGRVLRRLASTDSIHPWAKVMNVPAKPERWFRLVQPEVNGILNSRFPYGMNDGPLWAGRGLTVAVSGGVEGSAGPIEFRIAPQLFWAQNAGFPIAPTGFEGPQAFVDALYGSNIDLPQRFGDGQYHRIDPGQSVVQLHLMGFAVGATTGNETWGPAADSPFLLSANAAGFAHLFFGTDGPLDVGPLRASIRLIAGRLDQSPYAPYTGFTRRYISGAIVSVGVHGIPGLEVGAARLFENVWPDSGLSLGEILNPLLKNPFKARLAAQLGNEGAEPDNQLASAFFRWSVPRAGLELYGEMGREDNAYDLRDFLVEPDRDMSYSLGFQRVWRRPKGVLVALRGEVLNSAASHLAMTRVPAPPYIHAPIRQGHTQIGQALGAPGGFGGGARLLAVDWFTSDGRRSITWRRTVREPTMLPVPTDVVDAFTFEWLRFGRRVDLAPEGTLAYNLNRDGGGDALNLRAALSGRFHW